MKTVECKTCGISFRSTGVGSGRVVCCSDLCRRERKRERSLEYHKMKYATDPAYRAKARARAAAKWANPESRKKEREYHRLRSTDPVHREKKRLRALEHKRLKYATDPEWRDHHIRRVEIWRRKRVAIVNAVKELGLINIGDLK